MHVRSLKKIKEYQFVGRVTSTGAIVRFHCDLFHPPAEGDECHVTDCVFDTCSKLVKCRVEKESRPSDGPVAHAEHFSPPTEARAPAVPRKRARISFDTRVSAQALP